MFVMRAQIIDDVYRAVGHNQNQRGGGGGNGNRGAAAASADRDEDEDYLGGGRGGGGAGAGIYFIFFLHMHHLSGTCVGRNSSECYRCNSENGHTVLNLLLHTRFDAGKKGAAAAPVEQNRWSAQDDEEDAVEEDINEVRIRVP
jgi:hypothetical protein